MDIKKDDKLLLLKINTPEGIDFINAHNSIIKKHGFVWLCKFGKTNLLIDKLNSSKLKYIVLKDTMKNNNKVYIANYSLVTEDCPNANYPDYYSDIELNKKLWIKVTSIIPIKYDFLIDNFVTKSSSSNLESVFKSMCSTFYIIPKRNIEVAED